MDSSQSRDDSTLAVVKLPPTDYCTIAGRAHTSSALFELRTYDWREVHEACLVPPSSYLELTQIHAVGSYDRDNKEAWSKLGNVRYHPADNEFHCRWRADSQTVLLCAFNTEDAMGYNTDIRQAHLSKTHDLQNPLLFNLLARAQQELENPGLVSEIILEALSSAILTQWKQQFINMLDSPAQRIRGERLSQTDIYNISARIREQRKAPTIVELATEHGVSNRHFNRLFKLTAGETITAVYKRERLSKAKNLLTNPSLLIKEVAYLCGFETSAAFCKSFRATIGHSPQQFRTQIFGSN